MTTQQHRDAATHRAIALLIEVEQEISGVDRESELRAAALRHSLYRLLGFDNGRDYSDPITKAEQPTNATTEEE